MQTPILALTRPQRVERRGRPPGTVAGQNMRLLVQLRWIAVAGQLITIIAVRFGLGVPLPLIPMLAVVTALVLANHFARLILYRRPIGQPAIFMALLFDVAALALQLHLSGGASNPFISLFFLQLVLGAILLDPALVGVLVLVTATAYAAISLFGLPLQYPPGLQPFSTQLERVGAWISFALTGGLLAVFVSRVIRNLRARDAYLAELRQDAAEEDGIVRLGLLASGAAHELGTPLSSLSVVLNDWSRMPRVVADKELRDELAEMQADVGRCKEIVGDILHSVGAPNGEGVRPVAAAGFLSAVAEAWRPTHPTVALTVDADGLEDAVLVADPALRQVVASLLDNAAEASPTEVSLQARADSRELWVSILDRGPGFSPEQLSSVGKPYRSTKGAGRGLGLFLAAALARRLGGRLTASNRMDGGAEVRLNLPLLSNSAANPAA